MSRANKRDTAIRAELESIGAELAVIRSLAPLAQLRIRQTRERTGLDSLLAPALDEMDEINKAVTAMGEHISAALAKLEKM